MGTGLCRSGSLIRTGRAKLGCISAAACLYVGRHVCLRVRMISDFLSFRGAQRRGICCLLAPAHSRFLLSASRVVEMRIGITIGMTKG